MIDTKIIRLKANLSKKFTLSGLANNAQTNNAGS